MPGDKSSGPEADGATAGSAIREALRCAIQRHLATAAAGILEDCLRLTDGANGETAQLLGTIMQELGRVREEYYDHRTARRRLEQMQSEKLFAFADRIDPESFRILCAVMANGTVAKASRALNMKDSTIRTRMARWPKLGSAYLVLADLVRWRKAMEQKGTVVIPESVLKNSAPQIDFQGLLSDLLDEVLSMDGENWSDKAEALAALLRPYVER